MKMPDIVIGDPDILIVSILIAIRQKYGYRNFVGSVLRDGDSDNGLQTSHGQVFVPSLRSSSRGYPSRGSPRDGAPRLYPQSELTCFPGIKVTLKKCKYK